MTDDEIRSLIRKEIDRGVERVMSQGGPQFVPVEAAELRRVVDCGVRHQVDPEVGITKEELFCAVKDAKSVAVSFEVWDLILSSVKDLVEHIEGAPAPVLGSIIPLHWGTLWGVPLYVDYIDWPRRPTEPWTYYIERY